MADAPNVKTIASFNLFAGVGILPTVQIHVKIKTLPILKNV